MNIHKLYRTFSRMAEEKKNDASSGMSWHRVAKLIDQYEKLPRSVHREYKDTFFLY